MIDLILKHLNTVEECLTTAVETVETYLKDELPKAKILALKVDGIETQPILSASTSGISSIQELICP